MKQTKMATKKQNKMIFRFNSIWDLLNVIQKLIQYPSYLHNTHTTVFRLVRPLLVEFVVSLVYASVSLRAFAILYVHEGTYLLVILPIYY